MGLCLWTIKIMMMYGTFFVLGVATQNASFDENYDVTWGNDHVLFLNQGREVRLLLDEASGFFIVFFSYKEIFFNKFFLNFL